MICTCIKKDGVMCSYRAKPDSPFCGVHKKCQRQPTRIDMNLFSIKKSLGKGGFGETFLVTDRHGRHHVIKKSLKKRNADIIRQYNNLTTVKDLSPLFVQPVTISDDHDFFVMEYLDGFQTIDHIIKKKIDVPSETKRTWSEHLIEGVSLLHQKGIAHCDIKPANVMVHIKKKEIKIIDFGLACVQKDCIDQNPSGTYHYMPPEWLVNFTFREGKKTTYRKKMSFQECIKYDIWATGMVILWLCHSKRYSNSVYRLLKNEQRSEYYTTLIVHSHIIKKANARLQRFLHDKSMMLVIDPLYRHF